MNDKTRDLLKKLLDTVVQRDGEFYNSWDDIEKEMQTMFAFCPPIRGVSTKMHNNLTAFRGPLLNRDLRLANLLWELYKEIYGLQWLVEKEI